MTTYLCGYYGMLNTGDDALLQATAWGAQKYLNAHRFLISSPNKITVDKNKEYQALLVNRQRFKGENRLRHYFSSLRSSRVIFGGGSVLHNSHDINQKRHMIKLSSSKKALALGVGLGPFVNAEAERSCAHFLNECEFVGLRDKHSFEMAKTIAPNANTALTFDLAPQLLKNPRLTLSPTKKKGVCFCLCPSERLKGDKKSEDKRLRAISEAIKKVHEEMGSEITLLDFNGHEKLGDNEVHSELKSHLPESIRVNHVSYNSDPISVMEYLSAFNVVIGMRLHASIMAYLVGTPVISLNYHSKCNGWCDQIGLSEDLQVSSDGVDANHLSAMIVQGMKNGFQAPTLPIETAVQYSLKNWRV